MTDLQWQRLPTILAAHAVQGQRAALSIIAPSPSCVGRRAVRPPPGGHGPGDAAQPGCGCRHPCPGGRWTGEGRHDGLLKLLLRRHQRRAYLHTRRERHTHADHRPVCVALNRQLPPTRRCGLI